MAIDFDVDAEFINLDIQELSGSNSLRAFSELCDRMKIKNFLILSLDQINRTLKEAAIFSNWPPGFLEMSGEFDLHSRTKLPELASHSSMPFNWRFTTVDDNHRTNFESILQESSLLNGLVLPMHDASRSGIAAIVTGNELNLSGTQIGTLLLATANVFESHKTFNGVKSKRTDYNLSQRELECLNLTALGKTAHEIGVTYNLSEHTINCYIKSACNRLGATSLSNAVALALKAGIIT